ncbi:heterokaryon incompatibility protein-domain-containing protein [Chaetomium sp. MPI-CAGE-AT-0009]|nr:heterokaryon incompatibility protein-domain-containing protein [Chaetomium sp. MPI-CAGE-AT-0009]
MSWQARRNTSDGNLENEYRYSPLRPGNIRLLRLMPHKDESADLQCQLFDYPLQSSEGTHLYEALSYVWGDPHQRHSISVDGYDLLVTANLHAALLRLRDRFLERIVWVDAICINQDDNEEKGNQIRSMAEIYSKASRVTVWLGEAEDDGERALEAISRSATETFSEALFDDSTTRAIRLLLQRPWFKRIWVLQEVAAARNVLIKCGSTEIDGYAFSMALNSKSLALLPEDSPGLQLVRSVTYLVRGAGLRPKRLPKSSGRFSLRIRALGELIDMYCAREAAQRHDKVFALLGMSSDDPIAAGLSPDYGIPWEILLERLVRYLLGEQVAVKTWHEMELAIIRSKGLVLGYISASTGYADQDGRHKVTVILVDAYGNLSPEKEWSLPPSAESVEVGDLVCLLGTGASPTIVRSQKDHFSVIMIATPYLQSEQPTSNISHDFLLVWDWEKSRGNPRDRGREEYKLWMKDRLPGHSDGDVGGHFDRMTAWNITWILEDAGNYAGAEKELLQIIRSYESQFGKENLLTLRARDELALIYAKAEDWWNAKRWVKPVIEARMRLQGTDHPDTTRSRATLVSIYRAQVNSGEEKTGVIIWIFGRREGDSQMTEHEVGEIAKSFDEDVMILLLDQRGDQVKITEAVLAAAAGNKWSVDVEVVVRLLLDRGGDKVKSTEAVLVAAAGNSRYAAAIMPLLLDRGRDEAKITEAVLAAVAGNKRSGKAVMRFLRVGRGDKLQIEDR